MTNSGALLDDELFDGLEALERKVTPSRAVPPSAPSGPGIRQAKRTLALPGESSRDLSALVDSDEPPLAQDARKGPSHPSGTFLIGEREGADATSSHPSALPSRTARTPAPAPELHLGSRTAEPPLETARLRIVPVEAKDAYEFYEAVQKSRRTLRKVLPWVEYVRGPLDALAYLRSSERDWDEQRAYRFTIRDGSSGEFLGIVGFENVVLFHAAMDIGYWLRSDRTGDGRMSEAVHAVLTRAKWSWRVHRFRAFAAKENGASHAILEKFGFQKQGEIPEAEWCNGRWLDHVAFGALGRDLRL